MFAQRNRTENQGAFTLVELFFCVLIVLVLAVVLFPVFANKPDRGPRATCLRNEKMIGLAFLQYTQDYDEIMPPARAYGTGANAPILGASWENVVFPYVKSAGVFHCPDVPINDREHPQPTYRYSDLLPEVKFEDIVCPAHTILTMDGDMAINDVGHAWTPDQSPRSAVLNRQGLCNAGEGATVKDAPTRHSGYAFYSFADGHVKSLPPSQVFFPPRISASRSHKDADSTTIGPDPAGYMTFAGTTYLATFHLR